MFSHSTNDCEVDTCNYYINNVNSIAKQFSVCESLVRDLHEIECKRAYKLINKYVKAQLRVEERRQSEIEDIKEICKDNTQISDKDEQELIENSNDSDEYVKSEIQSITKSLSASCKAQASEHIKDDKVLKQLQSVYNDAQAIDTCQLSLSTILSELI